MPFTAEELEERKGYIGASEAAAVLGLSRWGTPLSVWSEKTGQIQPDPNDNELAKWWGNEFEDTVAKRFMKETRKKVRRVNEAYTHKKYPFIKCHVDRIVEGEDAVLECKMATVYKAKEWDGEDQIPQEYILQVYHQLACTGRKKAYIAVAIGNTEFQIKEVLRDDKVINSMIQKEAYFWNTFVVPKVMPSQILADDADVLQQLFPKATEGTTIEIGDELDRIKESLDALSKDKFIVEKEIDKLKNEAKALLGTNETGLGVNHSVSWKNVHRDAYTVKETDYRQLKWKLLIKGE